MARDDRLQRMALEGEVSLYRCKARDDARRIASLEDERNTHLATIAVLQVQAEASAASAASHQRSVLEGIRPISAANTCLAGESSEAATATATVAPTVNGDIPGPPTPPPLPFAEVEELRAELEVQREAVRRLLLEADGLRKDRGRLESRCLEL